MRSQHFNTKSNPIILYDGKCGLCNSSLQFIIKNEETAELKFCPLDSIGEKIPQLNSNVKELPDSIHFLRNGQIFIESDAIIEIVKFLKWPYKLLKYIKIIPKPIRDYIYRNIAKRRLLWHNESDTNCNIEIQYTNRML